MWYVVTMQTNKACSRCKIDKPASDYTTRTGAKGKVFLQSRCRQCAVDAAKAHKEAKFPTKAEYNEHIAQYRRTESGALSWFRTKAKRLGLSVEEVERAVASYKAHDGKCEICKVTLENIYIDHCHETMTFRGLLCTRCNTMLGYGRDNADTLRAGALYVDSHRAGL